MGGRKFGGWLRVRLWPFYTYLAVVIVLLISISIFGWTRTWTAAFVPTMYPPFADMRAIQGAVVSAEQGLDPQESNPGDIWRRPMLYPRIWLDIAQLTNLRDERRFRILCEFMILCFVGLCAFSLYRLPSPELLVCMISTSTLLAVERANNDLIIFCLVFLYGRLLPRKSAAVAILLATALKFYPAFALAAFLVRQRMRLFAASSIVALLILYAVHDQMRVIWSATTRSAWLSYGLLSLRVLFVEHHLPLWSFLAAVTSIAAAVLIVTVYFVRLDRFRSEFAPDNDLAFNLFLCGASLYVGTFIFASNFDYKLIFLMLCIPHLRRRPFRCAWLVKAAIIVAMNEMLLRTFGALGVTLSLAAKVGSFIVLSAWLIAATFAILEPRGRSSRWAKSGAFRGAELPGAESV